MRIKWRESVLNRDIANVQSLSAVNAGPLTNDRVVLEMVQVSLYPQPPSSPQHCDHHHHKETKEDDRILFVFVFLLFVLNVFFWPHISQLPAQAKTIISWGRLWFGFGKCCPNGVRRRRDGQKNRWRIHATLVIYDSPILPLYSLLLWFAFSFFPFWARKRGEGVYSSRA